MTAGDAVNIQTYLIRIFGLPLNVLPGWSGAVQFILCFCILTNLHPLSIRPSLSMGLFSHWTGVPKGGFKGCIVARSPRERYGGLG